MRRARGFTLIEVLVALTMFAVVGGALLQLFQGGLRSVRKADDRTHAALLARSKLTELRVFSHHRPGQLSGTLDNGYRWHAELAESESQELLTSGALRPLELTLTIHWGEPGEENAFSLQSILLTRKADS
jgi:general secretion pathway protein I